MHSSAKKKRFCMDSHLKSVLRGSVYLHRCDLECEEVSYRVDYSGKFIGMSPDADHVIALLSYELGLPIVHYHNGKKEAFEWRRGEQTLMFYKTEKKMSILNF